MKSPGKVLTIFVVIIAILLVSMTAISLFFFQKEIEIRKIAEASAQKAEEKVKGLEEENKQVKKAKFLLEEKNKEADERINSLLDELELEQGLREEMKKEAASLKEQIQAAKKAKEEIQQKQKDGLAETNRKITELEAQLEKVTNDKKILGENIQLKEKSVQAVQGSSKLLADEFDIPLPIDVIEDEVKLDKIVVTPKGSSEGRVLNVDIDTEFVIVNLGKKDGIITGQILSVYRGNEYLGDIQVTRAQPEMSAADLIPPFSSRVVRKNDQVVVKK